MVSDAGGRAGAFLDFGGRATTETIMNVPVFARISGADSEKAREMLQGSRAKLYNTVEEAIQSVISAVNNKGK
jgi:succinyl-CoA synthetase beta subunit